MKDIHSLVQNDPEVLESKTCRPCQQEVVGNRFYVLTGGPLVPVMLSLHTQQDETDCIDNDDKNQCSHSDVDLISVCTRSATPSHQSNLELRRPLTAAHTHCSDYCTSWKRAATPQNDATLRRWSQINKSDAASDCYIILIRLNKTPS